MLNNKQEFPNVNCIHSGFSNKLLCCSLLPLDGPKQSLLVKSTKFGWISTADGKKSCLLKHNYKILRVKVSLNLLNIWMGINFISQTIYYKEIPFYSFFYLFFSLQTLLLLSFTTTISLWFQNSKKLFF